MGQNELAKINLWDIAEEFEALEEMIIDAGGEVTGSHDELMEHVESILKTKTDGVVGYIDQQKDLIKLADEKIKALTDFKKARKKAIEGLSGYVIACMEKMETPKIQGSFHKIAIRKPVQIVSIDDETKVPMSFTKVIPATVSIDKVELKKALKNGEIIEGITLVDGKKSLTISKRTA